MKKTLLLLLSLPILGGCSSPTVTKPDTAAPPLPAAPVARPVADNRVIIDPDLGGAVRVLTVSATAGGLGYLRVELRVQNQRDAVQTFNYQFDWTDRNGTSLDLPTPIIPMTLMAHETTTLVAMAPSPLAKDFRVYFFPVTAK